MPVYSGERFRASLFLLILFARTCSDALYFSRGWIIVSSHNLKAVADLQEVKITAFEICTIHTVKHLYLAVSLLYGYWRDRFVVVVLLFYVHGRHLRSGWDGQLTKPHFSWADVDRLSG